MDGIRDLTSAVVFCIKNKVVTERARSDGLILSRNAKEVLKNLKGASLFGGLTLSDGEKVPAPREIHNGLS